jgi:hypothetical protein
MVRFMILRKKKMKQKVERIQFFFSNTDEPVRLKSQIKFILSLDSKESIVRY